MGRWSHLDTDEERLPEGMTRIAYDADTQTYMYRDADGSHWQGAPGVEYGTLRRVKSQEAPPLPSFEAGDEVQGEEPAYVLHDPDDDDDEGDHKDEKREPVTASPTEPKKAHLAKLGSLSKKVSKILPELPPLPIHHSSTVEMGGVPELENRQQAPKPRRRSSTVTSLTREVAQGVQQMFSEKSEFRGHRT